MNKMYFYVFVSCFIIFDSVNIQGSLNTVCDLLQKFVYLCTFEGQLCGDKKVKIVRY